MHYIFVKPVKEDTQSIPDYFFICFQQGRRVVQLTMLRLKPSIITLAVTEIREYDDHVRFKNHLRRCQMAEVCESPSSPTEQKSPAVETDSDDTEVWSDDATVDNGTRVVTFADHREPGISCSEAARATRHRSNSELEHEVQFGLQLTSGQEVKHLA